MKSLLNDDLLAVLDVDALAGGLVVDALAVERVPCAVISRLLSLHTADARRRVVERGADAGASVDALEQIGVEGLQIGIGRIRGIWSKEYRN